MKNTCDQHRDGKAMPHLPQPQKMGTTTVSSIRTGQKIHCTWCLLGSQILKYTGNRVTALKAGEIVMGHKHPKSMFVPLFTYPCMTWLSLSKFCCLQKWTQSKTGSSLKGGLFCSKRWFPLLELSTHVRYCTTRNMITQVKSIPPIMKYLSWKALFSISRITVFDKPSMLATSKIFLWVSWVTRRKENISLIIHPFSFHILRTS